MNMSARLRTPEEDAALTEQFLDAMAEMDETNGLIVEMDEKEHENDDREKMDTDNASLDNDQEEMINEIDNGCSFTSQQIDNIDNLLRLYTEGMKKQMEFMSEIRCIIDEYKSINVTVNTLGRKRTYTVSEQNDTPDIQTINQLDSLSSSSLPGNSSSTKIVKRGRGRPPKCSTTKLPKYSGPKRGRGRPRKEVSI